MVQHSVVREYYDFEFSHKSKGAWSICAGTHAIQKPPGLFFFLQSTSTWLLYHKEGKHFSFFWHLVIDCREWQSLSVCSMMHRCEHILRCACTVSEVCLVSSLLSSTIALWLLAKYHWATYFAFGNEFCRTKITGNVSPPPEPIWFKKAIILYLPERIKDFLLGENSTEEH